MNISVLLFGIYSKYDTEIESDFFNPFSLNEGFIGACFSKCQMFVPGTTLCKCYALAVVKAVFLNYGNVIQAKHQPLMLV